MNTADVAITKKACDCDLTLLIKDEADEGMSRRKAKSIGEEAGAPSLTLVKGGIVSFYSVETSNTWKRTPPLH
jgi:hypothetical protein